MLFLNTHFSARSLLPRRAPRGRPRSGGAAGSRRPAPLRSLSLFAAARPAPVPPPRGIGPTAAAENNAKPRRAPALCAASERRAPRERERPARRRAARAGDGTAGMRGAGKRGRAERRAGERGRRGGSCRGTAGERGERGGSSGKTRGGAAGRGEMGAGKREGKENRFRGAPEIRGNYGPRSAGIADREKRGTARRERRNERGIVRRSGGETRSREPGAAGISAAPGCGEIRRRDAGRGAGRPRSRSAFSLVPQERSTMSPQLRPCAARPRDARPGPERR